MSDTTTSTFRHTPFVIAKFLTRSKVWMRIANGKNKNTELRKIKIITGQKKGETADGGDVGGEATNTVHSFLTQYPAHAYAKLQNKI